MTVRLPEAIERQLVALAKASHLPTTEYVAQLIETRIAETRRPCRLRRIDVAQRRTDRGPTEE